MCVVTASCMQNMVGGHPALTSATFLSQGLLSCTVTKVDTISPEYIHFVIIRLLFWFCSLARTHLFSQAAVLELLSCTPCTNCQSSLFVLDNMTWSIPQASVAVMKGNLI